MQLRIIKPGLLSTIQDLGRKNYLADAVPVSGAMDTISARIANKALGNPDNSAVIEFTFAGAELLAQTDVLIACAGGGALLEINKQIVPCNRPVFIPAQTTIKLVNSLKGSRTYLAVAGGWNVTPVLSSRSTYITARLGGLEGRALKAGDILSTLEELTPLSEAILNRLKSEYVNFPKWQISTRELFSSNSGYIRVVPGQEFTWFDSTSIINFLSYPFSISAKSNRMGYHLAGAPIIRKNTAELLSTAVTSGTIQVTGSGTMVLLMADCQTTGGYPRIAQVAAVDLPVCGQLKQGDEIFFREISLQEAEMLYIEQERHLHQIGITIANKFL